MKYTPVIGLEVHVELKTKSKMFCKCSADYFGKDPNTHTCPTCLGLPGALPYPNKKAIEWCVMIGLALNCEIPPLSKFDRKNYFYPDLPKGYQISQYDMPFCVNGFIELSNGKKINIRRVHMEEDTGKLIHQGSDSLIDFNRSGVPLVEIVTEPNFNSSDEVNEYLKKLQQIVRYLEVSDANMEKGEMRLEPNISLRKAGEKELPNYKVEVKNINSFSFVGKAIDYEIKRQSKILEKGNKPTQETRGFVEKTSSTVSQRIKEEASDYRYFPEPDIPPIRWAKEEIEELRKLVREKSKQSPQNRIMQLMTYGMSNASAASITASEYRSSLFGTAISENLVPRDDLGKFGTVIANLPEKKIQDNQIQQQTKKIFDQYVKGKITVQVNEEELNKVIDKVLKENPKAISDFKKGKENAIMFLVGAAMRSLKVKADAEKIKASLLAKLK